MHIYTKVYVWGWTHSYFSSSVSLLSALHSGIGPSEHFTASHASSMFWCHYSRLVAEQAFREARRIGYLRPVHADRQNVIVRGRCPTVPARHVELTSRGTSFLFLLQSLLSNVASNAGSYWSVHFRWTTFWVHLLSSWSLTSRSCEPVWPSGKPLGWQAQRPRLDSDSALLSLQKGCCLWTLSRDFVPHNKWNIKMVLIAAHLNVGVILMVTV